MKFRKKPVEIEAVQFTQDIIEGNLFDGKPLPLGVQLGGASYHPERRTINHSSFYIDTLEGKMKVSVGDWIIEGVKGEFYPCKPDIFKATYEPVGGSMTRQELVEKIATEAGCMIRDKSGEQQIECAEAMLQVVLDHIDEVCEIRPMPKEHCNIAGIAKAQVHRNKDLQSKLSEWQKAHEIVVGCLNKGNKENIKLKDKLADYEKRWHVAGTKNVTFAKMISRLEAKIERARGHLKKCFRTYGKSTFDGLCGADKIRCMKQSCESALNELNS